MKWAFAFPFLISCFAMGDGLSGQEYPTDFADQVRERNESYIQLRAKRRRHGEFRERAREAYLRSRELKQQTAEELRQEYVDKNILERRPAGEIEDERDAQRAIELKKIAEHRELDRQKSVRDFRYHQHLQKKLRRDAASKDLYIRDFQPWNE